MDATGEMSSDDEEFDADGAAAEAEAADAEAEAEDSGGSDVEPAPKVCMRLLCTGLAYMLQGMGRHAALVSGLRLQGLGSRGLGSSVPANGCCRREASAVRCQVQCPVPMQAWSWQGRATAALEWRELCRLLHRCSFRMCCCGHKCMQSQVWMKAHMKAKRSL